MKSPSTKIRFSEAQKLLDYGFNNYSYKNFAKKGDILKSIIISKGVENTLDAVFESDFGILLKTGQEKDVSQSITIDNNLIINQIKNLRIRQIIRYCIFQI